MSVRTTTAVVLRRRAYGDADLVVTLLTRDQGKIAAIAKAAKKSVRRFAGALEPFCLIEAVVAEGRGMPLLQEAALIDPFGGLRADIAKTAYAGCWVEIIDAWMEDGAAEPCLVELLCHCLEALDRGDQCPQTLNIFFHMQFLVAAGLAPGLCRCGGCGRGIEGLAGNHLFFDPLSARLLCRACVPEAAQPLVLSKGTIKQLLWMGNADRQRCRRLRFTQQGLCEGGRFLECVVAAQIGRKPRSLEVLRQLQGG